MKGKGIGWGISKTLEEPIGSDLVEESSIMWFRLEKSDEMQIFEVPLHVYKNEDYNDRFNIQKRIWLRVPFEESQDRLIDDFLLLRNGNSVNRFKEYEADPELDSDENEKVREWWNDFLYWKRLYQMGKPKIKWVKSKTRDDFVAQKKQDHIRLKNGELWSDEYQLRKKLHLSRMLGLGIDEVQSLKRL